MKRLWDLLKPRGAGNFASGTSGGKDLVVNAHCTEFEVNNWALSELVVERLVPVVGVHPFPLPELFLMAAAVCRLRPTHVFEWGTHHGKSARAFYETASYLGLDMQVHSIDLPSDVEHGEHPGQRRGELVRDIPEVTLHLGDGLTVALELVGKMAPRRPLFFVDGDHEYESVRRELRAIVAQVPEAQILLHDTFYQSEESGYNIGPHRAIKDTLADIPDRFRVIETVTGLPGMTLLYRL